MMENKERYNFDEFLGLLLLYAAHVDVEYSSTEQGFIHDLVADKAYERVSKDFNAMTDYQVLQEILSYKDQYFANDEAREKLMEKLELLFYADGEYHPIEKELKHFLEKLMS